MFFQGSDGDNLLKFRSLCPIGYAIEDLNDQHCQLLKESLIERIENLAIYGFFEKSFEHLNTASQLSHLVRGFMLDDGSDAGFFQCMRRPDTFWTLAAYEYNKKLSEDAFCQTAEKFLKAHHYGFLERLQLKVGRIANEWFTKQKRQAPFARDYRAVQICHLIYQRHLQDQLLSSSQVSADALTGGKGNRLSIDEVRVRNLRECVKRLEDSDDKVKTFPFIPLRVEAPLIDRFEDESAHFLISHENLEERFMTCLTYFHVIKNSKLQMNRVRRKFGDSIFRQIIMLLNEFVDQILKEKAPSKAGLFDILQAIYFLNHFYLRKWKGEDESVDLKTVYDGMISAKQKKISTSYPHSWKRLEDFLDKKRKRLPAPSWSEVVSLISSNNDAFDQLIMENVDYAGLDKVSLVFNKAKVVERLEVWANKSVALNFLKLHNSEKNLLDRFHESPRPMQKHSLTSAELQRKKATKEQIKCVAQDLRNRYLWLRQDLLAARKKGDLYRLQLKLPPSQDTLSLVTEDGCESTSESHLKLCDEYGQSTDETSDVFEPSVEKKGGDGQIPEERIKIHYNIAINPKLRSPQVLDPSEKGGAKTIVLPESSNDLDPIIHLIAALQTEGFFGDVGLDVYLTYLKARNESESLILNAGRQRNKTLSSLSSDSSSGSSSGSFRLGESMKMQSLFKKATKFKSGDSIEKVDPDKEEERLRKKAEELKTSANQLVDALSISQYEVKLIMNKSVYKPLIEFSNQFTYYVTKGVLFSLNDKFRRIFLRNMWELGKAFKVDENFELWSAWLSGLNGHIVTRLDMAKQFLSSDSRFGSELLNFFDGNVEYAYQCLLNESSKNAVPLLRHYFGQVDRCLEQCDGSFRSFEPIFNLDRIYFKYCPDVLREDPDPQTSIIDEIYGQLDEDYHQLAEEQFYDASFLIQPSKASPLPVFMRLQFSQTDELIDNVADDLNRETASIFSLFLKGTKNPDDSQMRKILIFMNSFANALQAYLTDCFEHAESSGKAKFILENLLSLAERVYTGNNLFIFVLLWRKVAAHKSDYENDEEWKERFDRLDKLAGRECGILEKDFLKKKGHGLIFPFFLEQFPFQGDFAIKGQRGQRLFLSQIKIPSKALDHKAKTTIGKEIKKYQIDRVRSKIRSSSYVSDEKTQESENVSLGKTKLTDEKKRRRRSRSISTSFENSQVVIHGEWEKNKASSHNKHKFLLHQEVSKDKRSIHSHRMANRSSENQTLKIEKQNQRPF